MNDELMCILIRQMTHANMYLSIIARAMARQPATDVIVKEIDKMNDDVNELVKAIICRQFLCGGYRSPELVNHKKLNDENQKGRRRRGSTRRDS